MRATTPRRHTCVADGCTCRYVVWERGQAGGASASSGQAVAVPGGQLSIWDLPGNNTDKRKVIATHAWIKSVIRDFAEHKYPGDPAQQEQLSSTSLLRVESATVAEALAHWVTTSTQRITPHMLTQKMSAARRCFYHIGR